MYRTEKYLYLGFCYKLPLVYKWSLLYQETYSEILKLNFMSQSLKFQWRDRKLQSYLLWPLVISNEKSVWSSPDNSRTEAIPSLSHLKKEELHSFHSPMVLFKISSSEQHFLFVFTIISCFVIHRKRSMKVATLAGSGGQGTVFWNLKAQEHKGLEEFPSAVNAKW